MHFIARRERIAYHRRNKDDRRESSLVAHPRRMRLETGGLKLQLQFQCVAAGVRRPMMVLCDDVVNDRLLSDAHPQS
jgi:hypothetical protein